jgi:sporulation protein YlmC with PRC-barrel domain
MGVANLEIGQHARPVAASARTRSTIMNGKNPILALAVAVALPLAGPAAAQTDADRGRGAASPAVSTPPGGAAASTAPAAAATHELKAVRLSTLEGVNLYDGNDKKIGEVKDLVLDPASGRVLHALISIGGVMGIGEKEYEVPTRQLQAFSRSAEEGVPTKVQLNAAPESLAPAKKLDKDSPYVLGTKLIGADVDDSDGKDAGEIKDVVVDLPSGEARFALIGFEDGWQADDKLVAFPMSSLKRGADGKDLALEVTRETVGQAPSVEKSRIDKVDLSTQPWMQAATGTGGGGAPAGGSPAGGSKPAAGEASGGATSSPAAGAPPGR